MFQRVLGFEISLAHTPALAWFSLVLLAVSWSACSPKPTTAGTRAGGQNNHLLDAGIGIQQPSSPTGVDSVSDGGLVSIATMPKRPDAGPCVTCTPEGGQYCGKIGDNCGNQLNCGDCMQDGYTCGGAGTDHVCGAQPDSGKCTLNKCDPENGLYCGTIGDGCGGALDCGTCPGDMECGAAGIPNLCGTPQSKGCTPYTCQNGDATYCGEIGDGCGGKVDCGDCQPGLECGARIPRLCGVPCPLCKLVQQCGNGVTTTVTGTAVTGAKMNPDPLYNAIIYIPNIDLGQQLIPLPDGPRCDRCTPFTLDNAVTSAITGPDGKFTLTDVPVGQGIPLIVQLGSWRMQTTIDTQPCMENQLPVGSVRLPRNQMEGDIPLTAIATGNVDRLQCLMRKIGIDDSEFTDPTGTGRIRMYVSNGSTVDANTPSLTQLAGVMTNPSEFGKYTQVLLPCEGGEFAKPTESQANFLDYVNKGGRAFATHYSYTWLSMNGPLASTAQWMTNAFPGGGMGMGGMMSNTLVANIDTTFQKGADFATWLSLTGALSNAMPPQITISEPRSDVTAVPTMSGGLRWIYVDDPASVQHFTIDTPVNASPDQTCGRVVFSDFHVLNAMTNGTTFPKECDDMPLSAQEKVLEFMLFDLASCIGPAKPPAPPPPPPPPPPAAPPPPLPPPPLN